MASGRQQTFLSWFPYWNNPPPAPPELPAPAPRRSPRPSPPMPAPAPRRSPRPSPPKPTTQQKLPSPAQSQAAQTQSTEKSAPQSPSPSPLPSASRKSGQSQSLLPGTKPAAPAPESPRTTSQLSKQFSIESPKQDLSPKTSRSQSPSQDASKSQPEITRELSGSTKQSIQLAPQTQLSGEELRGIKPAAPPPQSPRTTFQLSKQFSIESPKQALSPKTSRSQSPSQDASKSEQEITREISGSTKQSIQLAPQTQLSGEELPGKKPAPPPPQSPRTTSQLIKQFSTESPKQALSPKTSRSQSPSQDASKSHPEITKEISGSTKQSIQLAPQTQLSGEELPGKKPAAPPPQSPRTTSQIIQQFSTESPKQALSPKTSRSQSPSQDASKSQPEITKEISGSTKQPIQLAPQSKLSGEDHLETQSLSYQSTLSHPLSQPKAKDEGKPKPDPQLIDTEKRTLQDAKIITIIWPLVGSTSKNHDDGQPPKISEESTPEIASVPKKIMDTTNIILDEEAYIAHQEPTKDFQTSHPQLAEMKSKQVVKEDSMTRLEVAEVRETDRQESNAIEGQKEQNQPERPPTVPNEESNGRKEGKLSIAKPNPKTTRLRQQITGPLMEGESSIKHTNASGSKGNEQNMISSNVPPSLDHGQQSSFSKDIKEGIIKLVQKLNSGQTQNLGNENAISIITLAGENKGASMYIGHETMNSEVSISTKEGHTLSKDKGNGTSEKKATSDERSDQAASVNETITINSNVQNINNSLLHDSSCSQEDPGVHLTFGGKSYKLAGTENGIEKIETSKSVFGLTPARKFMYEPRITNRYSEGSYHDSFDNNPQSSKCYGCQFNGDDKVLDY